MRTRRVIFITVIAAVAIATADVVIHADQPQAFLSPDSILKGTTPTITITLDKGIPNQDKITGVRVGGQSVAVQKPSADGKLFVLLPKLDIVGRADVEVIGKDDNLVAVGQLHYVESAGQSSKGLNFLWIYVVLIVLLPLSCTIYDICQSYKERSNVLSILPLHANIEEIKALLAGMDQGPTGLTGLTRGIVAVTLILLLAFAVFHLVVFAPDKVPDIAEKLLMLLAGTLTAITGFYFGSKASTEATSAAKSGETVSTVVPRISRLDPPSGAAGSKVKVIGEGFGAQGTVTFRGKGADGKEVDKEGTITGGTWTNTQIEVTVPLGVNAGTVDVVVTNGNGTSSKPCSFQIN